MGHSNLQNFALVVLVPLPSIAFHVTFLWRCNSVGDFERQWWKRICFMGGEHPFYVLNLLFLLNVDVLFWLVGLIQSSVWLIDPYWTIIPVFIAHFYSSLPTAQSNVFRSRAALSLIWVWSFRLTYNYFRREKWQWGKREDWRFTDIREADPSNWWWKSFFVCFLSQHIFLVGITLPLLSVFTRDQSWNSWDSLAVTLCACGIVVAHFADSQLSSFVSKNITLSELGAAKDPVLNKGLWYYSRHPNYFGEQLFWWGFSLFSVGLGHPWFVVGTATNSACLAYTTVLVEKRIMRDESRASIYRDYIQCTSVLFPWFKRSNMGKPKLS